MLELEGYPMVFECEKNIKLKTVYTVGIVVGVLMILANAGYENWWDGLLYTVWSAPNYCYRGGNAACVFEITNPEKSRIGLSKKKKNTQVSFLK